MSKVLVLFMCFFCAMVSVLIALILDCDLLFIFARMMLGLNTQLLTYGCMTDFPWKICPHNTEMQSLFFLLTALRSVSESTEECVLSTELSVQFGPVRTIPNQTCFSSWHHKIKASGCAQTLCIFLRSGQCANDWPPQLIVENRQRCFVSTRIVDPKLFSQEVLIARLGLNDV